MQILPALHAAMLCMISMGNFAQIDVAWLMQLQGLRSVRDYPEKEIRKPVVVPKIL